LCISANLVVEEGLSVASDKASFYRYVGDQLAKLAKRFRLEKSQAKIANVYGTICRESLAIPRNRWPPSFSRINEDGTPFQYALTLGEGLGTSLQFLGETAVPGSPNADRLRLSRQRIQSLVDFFGVGKAFSEVVPLLDAMIPSRNPDLLANHAGAIWIGAGFLPGEEPRLKIYLNVKWGSESSQWARFNAFALHFDSVGWRRLANQLKDGMAPLGMAITLQRNHPVAARIYLSAYGKPIAYYEGLGGSVGGTSFRQVLEQYAVRLLREDYPYPTPSAVCSFGLDPTVLVADFKWEICGHCVFASDLQAKERCLDCIKVLGQQPDAYLNILGILSEGHLSETRTQLHSYLGLGIKGEHFYCTFYFKPRLGHCD